MSRFSWSKRKTKYGPDALELRRAGEVLAVFQEKYQGVWFSYGMADVGWNTAESPTSKIDAMKDAIRRYKDGKFGDKEK